MRRDTDWPAVFLAGSIFLLFFCLALAWNEWLYGDWRCLFASCRIEK
jgi:ABC-type multidrug transport system permease subunit